MSKRTCRKLDESVIASGFLDSFDYVLTDCDGVLWMGEAAIPGSVEAIKALKDLGKHIIYVTNNSTKARAEYLTKCTNLGFPAQVRHLCRRQQQLATENVDEMIERKFIRNEADRLRQATEHSDQCQNRLIQQRQNCVNSQFKEHRCGNMIEENIITTSYCAAAYLKLKNFQKKVYVLGSTGITQELDKANIQHLPVGPDPVPDKWIPWLSELKLDPEIGAVVVGFDHYISYPKLTKAASYLKKPETLFIATNRDEQFPAEGNLIIPGAGTFVSAVEVVTGRKSIAMGKPEQFMLDCIKEVHPDIDVTRCIMIGDRLNTDIIFGNRHGIRTILVLTGISSLEEVRFYEKSPDDNHQMQIPDFYLQCLGDLEKLIK